MHSFASAWAVSGLRSKMILRAAAGLCAALLLLTGGGARAAIRPPVPRYAAILVDADTREVLYANAADEIRHPASITKLMTLYLTFDAIESGQLRLSDRLFFSDHARAQKPSKLNVPLGQSISIDDAIRVIAVKSANDVAVALAERLGGTEQNFAQLMTRRARLLGMRSTVYTNASGLADPGNITTARDLAILSLAILRSHARFYPYFGTRAFTYGNATFISHNHLLGKTDGLDGIKTGYTVDAGFTLAASARRGNRRLVAVVLGEPNIPARSRDVTALLDAGFAVLGRRQLGQQTTVAANLPALNHPALRIDVARDQGSGDEAGNAPRAAPRLASHATRGATRHAARGSHRAKATAHPVTRTRASHAAHASHRSRRH